MTHLRRALAPLAAVWLSCQIGTVALGPVVAWVGATDPLAAECTCGQHGADATCPMHGHKPSGNTNSCAMQAANGGATTVFTTLLGVAGLMPESTPSLVAPVPSTSVGSIDVDVRGERPVPPDPPPPRA